MAKIIKLTPDVLDEIKRDFEEELAKAKLSDGKFNFSKTFGSITRKASVNFTEKAWQKMQALIREFDKEVAWHGIAYRGDDPTKDEYYITDILVYPQEVTGATVTADQVKYQTWLMEHDDDVFNNIRMQGHSHVNMSTSPSSVDLALYEKILEQLDDSMFYIFLIYNKRGEKTYMIYDMKKNVKFDTADITVNIIDDGTGINSFIADAKTKVQSRPSWPASTQGSYGGGTYGYPTYGSGYSSSYHGPAGGSGAQGTQPAAQPSKPAQTPSLPQSKGDEDSKKKESLASSKSAKKSSGRRKGKRRDRDKKTGGAGTTYGSSGKYGGYGYGGFDEDDYPGSIYDGYFCGNRY